MNSGGGPPEPFRGLGEEDQGLCVSTLWMCYFQRAKPVSLKQNQAKCCRFKPEAVFTVRSFNAQLFRAIGTVLVYIVIQ